MRELYFANQPELKESVMLAAWGGWPDAGNSATRALIEVTDQTQATRFATIDGELFFQFTEMRPVAVGKAADRAIEWPLGRFFYRKAQSAKERDLVLFYGNEPQLRWRTYCDLFSQLAGSCDTHLFITVGAYHHAVPHTVTPPVYVTTNHASTRREYRSLINTEANYEGPIAIGSAVADRFLQSDIPSISLWGGSPHYLDIPHNPDLTVALIETLNHFLPTAVNTTELIREGEEFRAEAQKYVDSVEDLQKYVRDLEENFQLNADTRLVQDVEDFLNERREADGS